MVQGQKKLGAQEQIVQMLRTRIAEGDLLPGAFLSEGQLADEFGVSRTPVREALKRLQAEGIVKIRPRVGSFVTAPSRKEILELFKVKEILEGAAAGMFAARGDAMELEALRENIHRSEAAISDDDIAQYETLVHEFHDIIIRGAGNEKLYEHYRTLMNQLRYGRFVDLSLNRTGRAGESEHEHEQVFRAINDRDELTAERLMRAHVRASQHALIDAMNMAAQMNSLISAT